MLGVAGGNLAERGAGPGDPRGRNQGRLWLARGAGVGGDANAATDCAPDVEGGAALLIAARNAKPSTAATTTIVATMPQPILGQGL